jgi:hypothetical protein
LQRNERFAIDHIHGVRLHLISTVFVWVTYQ